MGNMKDNIDKSRLEQLKIMLGILAESLDTSSSGRDLSQLARQYRETLKEIEEIEGVTGDNDEIGEILKQRESDRKPGAVR